MKINWYPSPEFLAQAGHVLLGILSVVWPRAMFDSFWYPVGGTAAVLIYMLIKEFSYDIYLELEDVRTGWKDVAYLTGGILIGWGSLYAAGRI